MQSSATVWTAIMINIISVQPMEAMQLSYLHKPNEIIIQNLPIT